MTATSDRYVCPPLKDYTKNQQARLANELLAEPKGSIWPTFIIDYSAHRDACRVIKDQP